MKLPILLFLTVVFTSIFADDIDPIVAIEDGQLRGERVTLPTGTMYYSFKGIPFAEPPVGALRFQEPKPVQSWTGIRNATQYGSDPLQQMGTVVRGSEDCLYINVYSRDLTGRLPVMVYIYGGAFQIGSSDSLQLGPDFLMDKDVVLVTFNYRVDAFGFLALDIPECPGNAGIKDQVLALEWVKKNIAMFGGDVDNVTIFGCSAGGASVSLLSSIPKARGLFHKAIAQSGSSFSDWAVTEHGQEYSILLANILGFESKNASEVYHFLLNAPADQLVGATKKVKVEMGDNTIFGELVFVPVVEVAGENPLIAKTPRSYVSNDEFSDIPFMSGVVSNEGILFWIDIVNEYEKFAEKPEEILFYADEENRNTFRYEYENHYSQFASPMDGLLRARMDESFLAPMIREADLLYLKKEQPIYLYSFDYEGGRNNRSGDIYASMLLKGEVTGAGHGDEQAYLFKTEVSGYPEAGSNDAKVVEYMVNLWYNFASTGDPNSELFETTWPAYKTDSKNFLVITEDLKVDPDLYKERIELWSRLHTVEDSNVAIRLRLPLVLNLLLIIALTYLR